MLAYLKFDLPFVLHTDVSATGLIIILFQCMDRKLRAVAYGSRAAAGKT